MKAALLILCICLGIFAVGAFVLRGASPDAIERSVSYAVADPIADSHPLEKTPPRIEVSAEEKSVAVKTPVQPLEERSDDMLFEIDALGGMPFDQAITMPFD